MSHQDQVYAAIIGGLFVGAATLMVLLLFFRVAAEHHWFQL